MRRAGWAAWWAMSAGLVLLASACTRAGSPNAAASDVSLPLVRGIDSRARRRRGGRCVEDVPDGISGPRHPGRSARGHDLRVWLSVLGALVLTVSSCGDAPPNDNDASPVGSEGWPSWSPDGALLAFVRTRSVDDGEGFVGEIFTMQPDGSGDRQLTDDADLRKSSPAWSPDGSRITFDGERPGYPWDIYVMNADGSDVRQLTFYGAPQGAMRASAIGAPTADTESATIPVVSGYWEPTWSPDGSRIVFSSYSEPRAGPRDIFTINLDGSDLRRLTWDLDAFAPAWSPDGSRIAFSSFGGDIFTMAADGGDIRQLTDRDDLHDADPAWSPDGVRIAFRRAGGATSDVAVMCADGTGLSRLATTSTDGQPAWSPDGSRIAISRGRDPAAGSRIHIIDVAQTALTRSEECSP